MTQVQTAEIVPQAETALMRATSMEATIAAQVEAQSRAMVQARYALAIRNPRDMDMCRQRLLKECSRPAFAEVARYAKKQGRVQNDDGQWVDNFVVGPTIRFAEAVLRFYGNVLDEEAIIHDDDERRVTRVTVTDLEVNLTYSKDVYVQKQVERSSAVGRDVISSRLNTNKKTTYLVRATEDEVRQREGTLASIALRNAALKLLPRDIRDECMARVVETQGAADKVNPDAQRNKVFDSFAKVGVGAADIKEYIGHEIGTEDLPMLRAILQSLNSGEAKWSKLVAEKKAEAEGEAPSGDLTAKLKAKAAEAERKSAEKTKKPEPVAALAPTPPDLMPYEAALAEAETLQQLEAARERYAAAVPLGAPGRERLDVFYIRRQGELK